MRFISFKNQHGMLGLAVSANGAYRGRLADDVKYPGELLSLLRGRKDTISDAAEALSSGAAIDPQQVRFNPPLPQAGKIICIGLNYADHTAESGQIPSSRI